MLVKRGKSMAQQSLIDAFDDCVTRLANGQSLEQCLNLYPDYSSRLRPMLEATITLRQVRVPDAQVVQDQALVWQKIMQELPGAMPKRRRGFPVGLLAAVLILLFLLLGMWVLLSRLELPPDDNNIINPATATAAPTLSATLSPIPSSTPTLTVTYTAFATNTLRATSASTLTMTQTATPTVTKTATPTSTPTKTYTPAPTSSPTATFVPGCAAPLTEQDAIKRVLEIYPNTSIVKIEQTVKFGDTLVWEVLTSHGIEINISVGCGVILTIEQKGSDNTNSNSNSNGNANANDNTNTNSNSNSNDNTQTDSGMGSGDNSGGSSSGGSSGGSGGGSGMG